MPLTNQEAADPRKTTAGVCFATLAFGSEYRHHAERLALDFAVHGASFQFLMLADKPSKVLPRANLQVFPYVPEGALRRYHDKRLLVRAGLDAGFSTVVVIDANSRLVESLPARLDLQPGVNAFVTQPLEEHLREEERQVTRRRRISTGRQRRCLDRAAGMLGVALDRATFIQESVYALHGPADQLRSFVRQWGLLGRYMDYHGLAWSEGFAIGLAAAATGMQVHENRFLPMNCFYKHRLHGALLARGQLDAPRVWHAQEEARLLARFLHDNSIGSRLGRLRFNARMFVRWALCRLRGEPNIVLRPQ